MHARLPLVLLVAASLLSGCGVLDDETPAVAGQPDPAVYGPAEAAPGDQPESAVVPKLQPPSNEVASAMTKGSIGVVDPGGVVTIEPSTLATAGDLTLEGLRWTRWGDDGATGEGRLRMLTCQPTCANGGTTEVAARVTLSGVKTCQGLRYFERGEVLIDPKDSPSGGQPATYLRAPC